MKKLFVLAVGLLAVAPALLCAGRAEDDPGDLLSAVITAIDLEIASTKGKLDTAQVEQKIMDLEAERARFAAMKPQDYPAPVPQQVGAPPVGAVLPPMIAEAVINVAGPCADGTLLDVQGATRSGPFYHLAGVKGGDYGILKPGRIYTVQLALVYRREYFGFIGDYYVYILSVRG
jgi:hypothetical protein